jgi:hypothetical protein
LWFTLILRESLSVCLSVCLPDTHTHTHTHTHTVYVYCSIISRVHLHSYSFFLIDMKSFICTYYYKIYFYIGSGLVDKDAIILADILQVIFMNYSWTLLCRTRFTRNFGQVKIFLKSILKLRAFQFNLFLLSLIL